MLLAELMSQSDWDGLGAIVMTLVLGAIYWALIRDPDR